MKISRGNYRRVNFCAKCCMGSQLGPSCHVIHFARANTHTDQTHPHRPSTDSSTYTHKHQQTHIHARDTHTHTHCCTCVSSPVEVHSTNRRTMTIQVTVPDRTRYATVYFCTRKRKIVFFPTGRYI